MGKNSNKVLNMLQSLLKETIYNKIQYFHPDFVIIDFHTF